MRKTIAANRLRLTQFPGQGFQKKSNDSYPIRKCTEVTNVREYPFSILAFLNSITEVFLSNVTGFLFPVFDCHRSLLMQAVAGESKRL